MQIGAGNDESVIVGNGNDTIILGAGSFDDITIGTGNDVAQIGAGNSNTVFEQSKVGPGTTVKFGTGTNNTIKKM